MKYDHIVKSGGVYYLAGEDVPDIKESQKDERSSSFFNDENDGNGSGNHKYTCEELSEIPVRKIRQIAESRDIEITKTIKDEVIEEFLSKQ